MVKRTTPAVAPAAVAPTAPADVAAVVDAAAVLATSATNASPEDAALAEAKAVFELPVVTPVPTAPVVIDPADTARDEAAALADAMNAEEPEAPARPALGFPCNVRLLNHSQIALSEPITGAFLAAGGVAIISLHDQEHAQSVSESLRKLVEDNYLSPSAIGVEPT